MHNTWLVVANANCCRIYNYQKAHHQLVLLKELDHHESRNKSSELTADIAGNFKAAQWGAGSFNEMSDHKDVEKWNFAKEIIHQLEEGRVDHDYQDVFIVAPPQFHGLLNKNINKNLSRMIVCDIQKDYCRQDEKQLLDFMAEHRADINSVE